MSLDVPAHQETAWRLQTWWDRQWTGVELFQQQHDSEAESAQRGGSFPATRGFVRAGGPEAPRRAVACRRGGTGPLVRALRPGA